MERGEPVPTSVPPQLALYQVMVPPLPPEAVREILPDTGVQKDAMSTEAEVKAVGVVVMVTVVL